MKKLYIAVSLFLASFAYSQVPQAFSYQTIAFNSTGAPIANGNVNLRISILDNSATGTVLYTETHTKTTNSKGLVNLNIGQGTATTGNFGGINWGTNTKFVKVEMDPAGGNNYTNVGVNQLMSVPYALVADKVDYKNIKNNPDYNTSFAYMTTTNAYVLAPYSVGGNTNSSKQWFTTAISGNPFSRVDKTFVTSTNAYVLAPYSVGGNTNSSNQWFTTSISGTPIKVINQAVATTSNAYVLAPYSVGGTTNSSNHWFTTPISGDIIDILNFGAYTGILTTTNAYVLAPYSMGGSTNSSNQWFTTPISGIPLKIKGDSKTDGIIFYTSTNIYVLAPYSVGGTTNSSNQWFSTSISGISQE